MEQVWCPRGAAGGGEGIPCLEGKSGGTIGRAEDQKGASWPAFTLLTWALGSLLRWSPDPLPTEVPSSCRGPERVGGRRGGAKLKAGPTGSAPLRGSRGRGRVPTPGGTHPQFSGDGGDTRESGGTEGSTASTFPGHLGTGEPLGDLGLILCPQRLPPKLQSLSPAPTHPPSALFLQAAL